MSHRNIFFLGATVFSLLFIVLIAARVLAATWPGPSIGSNDYNTFYLRGAFSECPKKKLSTDPSSIPSFNCGVKRLWGYDSQNDAIYCKGLGDSPVIADGSAIPNPLPIGKKLDCFQRILIDSNAPLPSCAFNTSDGGDYDLSRPETAPTPTCAYGSDGATGSITYTYNTLKDGKDGTCTKLTTKPTKTDNCCRGTPYTCTFDRCPSSKPSTPQQATCTQSSSYLGSASCPGTADKYVGGGKVTTFPPERACDACVDRQYTSCSQISCDTNGKVVNSCTTRSPDCSGNEAKNITTTTSCDACTDSQYQNCTAEMCSGSNKVKRCTSVPSICIGSMDSGQAYHTVPLGTCYTYYSSCVWNTSKCSETSGAGAGQKTRSCTEVLKTNLTVDTFQDSDFITSPLNCGDCSITTDYTCTFATNCPSTAPELTNRSSITPAMEAATCNLNNASNPGCKPLASPSQARTCTTCTKDVWTSSSWSTCDDSTSKQTLEQTETFNCTGDSNDESGTTYTVGGVTGTVKAGSKTEVGSNTPKLYKRTLEVDCTPAPGGNLPTGDIKGQTLRYNGSKWEKSIALYNYDGPKIGVGTGYSLTATPTEVLQVSANANKNLTSRLLVVDNDPFQAAGETSNNPEIQLQYATTTVSGAEKNWHWSLFVDKTVGSSQNSFNIWGAGYDGATGSNRLTILPNGNVGIGVSDPGLPLQIDHTTAPFMGFRTAGGGIPANSVRFSVGARDDVNAHRAEIEVQSKHDLAFFTSSTLRAAISSDGAFTIGTSTQFADSAALLVHKAAIPGTGVILGESATAPAAAPGSGPTVQPSGVNRVITDVPVSGLPIIQLVAPPSGTKKEQSPAGGSGAVPASEIKSGGEITAGGETVVPAGAWGVPVDTPATPKPANTIPVESGGLVAPAPIPPQQAAPTAPASTPSPAPTPSKGKRPTGPAGSSGGARAPETNFLASLTGFFSNLWSTITGSPIQSSYAVNLPRLSSGAVSPAVGAQTVMRKVLKGRDTLFLTGLVAGDYIYIPAKNALFMLESATSETEGTFIQIAGELTAATQTFIPIGSADSSPQSLAYSILKKGNVFRVERDMKDANGNPSIAADLVVDNRGIVNIGGQIAPPENSDLSLFVNGKAGAKEFCILGSPNDCATSWKALNPWVIKGDDVYRSKGKVGIGTANPTSQLDVLANIADQTAPTYTYTEAGRDPENGKLTPQCGCDSADGAIDCPNRWEGASKEFFEANDKCYDWRVNATVSKLYLKEGRPQGGGAMGNQRMFTTPNAPDGLVINYARFGYHGDLDTPGIIMQQFGKAGIAESQYIMGSGYMKGQNAIVNSSVGRAFGLQFNQADLSVISNTTSDTSGEGAVQKLFTVTPNGFIPPRVSVPNTFSADLPGEDGLTVWDTTEKKYKVYTNGVGWKSLGGNEVPFILEQGRNFTEHPVDFRVTRTPSSGQNYGTGTYRYTYRVVAEFSDGSKLIGGSDPIYLRQSLNMTNYVTIAWTALQDAKKYTLYRLVDGDVQNCIMRTTTSPCQGVTRIAELENSSLGTSYRDEGYPLLSGPYKTETWLAYSSNEYKAIFTRIESGQWMKFAVGTEQNTIDVKQRASVYQFVEDIDSDSTRFGNGSSNQQPCSFANAAFFRLLDTPPAVATEAVGTYCYDPYTILVALKPTEKWRTYQVVSRDSNLILAKDGDASLSGSLAIGYTQPSNTYPLAVNGGALVNGPIFGIDGRAFYTGATLNLTGNMGSKFVGDDDYQWNYEKYRRTFGLDDDRNMAIQIGALDELSGNESIRAVPSLTAKPSHSIGVTLYNGDGMNYHRYFYVAGRDTTTGCVAVGNCVENISFYTRPNDGKAYFKGAVAIGGALREVVTGSGLMLDVQGGDINVALGADTLALNKKDTLALAQGKVGYDVAELFDTEETVEAGDVLVVSARGKTLKKSSRPYEEGVIGIVSASPALVFEGSELKIGPRPNRFTKGVKPPIALSGRVSVNVSLENGSIKPGDFLTSSSKPGVAMKATKPGPTIGIALETYDGKGESSITVFVSLGEKNVKHLIDEVKDLRTRLEKLEKKK